MTYEFPQRHGQEPFPATAATCDADLSAPIEGAIYLDQNLHHEWVTRPGRADFAGRLSKNNCDFDAVLQVMADRLARKDFLKSGFSPSSKAVHAHWIDCADESDWRIKKAEDDSSAHATMTGQ